MAALQAAALLSSAALPARSTLVAQRQASSALASARFTSAAPRGLSALKSSARPSLHLRRVSKLQVVRSIAQPTEVETKTPIEQVNEIVVLSTSDEVPPQPETGRGGTKIWMSDVIAEPKRPYFFNREWTSKDIQYASYMTLVHGLCLFAPFTFSWSAFASFVVMYIITGMFGITLSYHRQLSHKSFVTPKWLEYVFAYCGVLAIQGSPMEWVSAHRFHHRHCDTEEDPHTPYEGFWHSHMGWLLDDTATSERVGVRSNIADMQNDPFYKFIEDTYIWHVLGSAAVLYALGGFPFIVWGLAVRAVWVYHITWAVNSAAHVWGYQSWNTGDLSRNNWWVAILAFGEGWHNNHHAFEYSARHGLEWWQYDPTWYTIKALEAARLAMKVRLPTQDHMARLSFPDQSAQ